MKADPPSPTPAAPPARTRATPQVGVPSVPRRAATPSVDGLHIDLSELAGGALPKPPVAEVDAAPESTPTLSALGRDLDALFAASFGPEPSSEAASHLAAQPTPFVPAASAFFVEVPEPGKTSPRPVEARDDDVIEVDLDALEVDVATDDLALELGPEHEVHDASPAAALAPFDRILLPRVRLHELPSGALDARGGFLMSRIDGTITLEELLDVCGMDHAEVLGLVHRWVDAGWVAFG